MANSTRGLKTGSWCLSLAGDELMLLGWPGYSWRHIASAFTWKYFSWDTVVWRVELSGPFNLSVFSLRKFMNTKFPAAAGTAEGPSYSKTKGFVEFLWSAPVTHSFPNPPQNCWFLRSRDKSNTLTGRLISVLLPQSEAKSSPHTVVILSIKLLFLSLSTSFVNSNLE